MEWTASGYCYNRNWAEKTSFFISSRGYHTEVIRVDNIIRYLAAMTLANKMLDDSIITRREFLAFEKRMREKYELPECSLYRDIHLLYPLDQR